MKLKQIFIVGGTHGNERGGIHLARAYNQIDTSKVVAPSSSPAWPNLRIRGVIANEKAVLQNTRYFDEDLNRCFTAKRLDGETTTTYESARAKELNEIMGPKGSNSKADFILDLHNSTSNTGMMLCLHRNDELALQVAAHLHAKNEAIKIVFWSKQLGDDQPFLPTIGKSGMTVELGSVCHGTTNAIAIERVRLLINQALDYLDHRATLTDSQFLAQSKEHMVNIGERVAQVDFPRDSASGDALAFIHADLQDIEELADGSALVDGQTLFAGIDGTPIVKFDQAQYGSGSKLYPVFVNEAAYFEKQTAFFLYERLEGVRVRI